MKSRKLKLSNRVVSILDTKQSQQVRGASQGCDTDSGPMCTIAYNECYDTYFCTDDCGGGGNPNPPSGGSPGNGPSQTSSCTDPNPGKPWWTGLGDDWT